MGTNEVEEQHTEAEPERVVQAGQLRKEAPVQRARSSSVYTRMEKERVVQEAKSLWTKF